MTNERLEVIKQSPRQASIDDIEWMCDEIDRLRPMAESWESYEAAQERKAEMRLADEASTSEYDRGFAVGSGDEGRYQRDIARLREALDIATKALQAIAYGSVHETKARSIDGLRMCLCCETLTNKAYGEHSCSAEKAPARLEPIHAVTGDPTSPIIGHREIK